MISLFSNAVTESRQGWVMGIFASTVAVAFIAAGLSTNLLSVMGVNKILLSGGVLSVIGAIILFSIRDRFIEEVD